MPDRVVVTGLGAISPYGAGIEALWQGLMAGESAVGGFTYPQLPPLPMARGGAVPAAAVPSSSSSHEPEPRCTSFAVAAAREAIEDARLPAGTLGSAWLFVGTVMGPRADYEETAPPGHSVRARPGVESLASTVAGQVGIDGISLVVGNACAGGNSALVEGAEAISRGEADVCVTGGAEELSATVVTMFRRLRSEASDQVRPFDTRRDGVLLGEGAGFLVLEALDHARRRGATILAEVVGWANLADAYHVTAPHPEGRGARRSMSAALESAGLGPADVDFLCAHGTGTPQNDAVEGQAIAGVFGRHVPVVTSVKGSIGHLQGASSAMDAVVCVSAVRRGAIPPTPTTTDPDPACRVVPVTQAVHEPVGVAMNNSFGFGGNVACVAYARHE